PLLFGAVLVLGKRVHILAVLLFLGVTALIYSVMKVLDKMLVGDIGDVTITNDDATIRKMLEVEHPAAKVL
ncbi:hypothetical protein MKW92_036572, partial [Papaver armeniacum]